MTETAGSAVRQDVYFEPELETLELGALRALQLERLKLVVARACERSTVYRELCRTASVKPDDIRVPRRYPPPALPRQDHAARRLSRGPAHLRPRRHRRGAQHLRDHRQAHAHLGVGARHGRLGDAQRALDPHGRPALGRPPAELLRPRAADERRPAVRRAARRRRRRARRHRPPRAAHRPHRRPGRHRHLHDPVLRPLPRRQGPRARHRPGARFQAPRRPLRRRALARVGPRAPRRHPRPRRLQRVRHGRVPRPRHGL